MLFLCAGPVNGWCSPARLADPRERAVFVGRRESTAVTARGYSTALCRQSVHVFSNPGHR